MILFFGPAGAGKSVQGQMMSARQGWRWLSTGQMFREHGDDEVKKILGTGELISDDKTFQVVAEALSEAEHYQNIIVDGFPRTMVQAEWLMDHTDEFDKSVEMVVVLEVPESVVLERLELRGRPEDSAEIVTKRMNIYRREMYPVLGYFAEKGISIAHIDGTGSVGEVHDRIQSELQASELAA